MKWLLAWLCAFGWLTSASQDINVLIKEAESLEANLNEKAAFEKYKQILRSNPVHLNAINKCSELCSRIGRRENTAQSRNDYYTAAKTYATIALKINPSSSEANCVMAIALGRISLEKGGKEKVNAAKEIKKYVDLSLKYDPNNYKALHVLGKWHYEICNLNFIERAAVKIIFGGMPRASLPESIQAYEKAKLHSTGFILNYLELAKALKKNNEKQKAIQMINEMLLLPDKTEDDESIKQEGRKLLKKWN